MKHDLISQRRLVYCTILLLCAIVPRMTYQVGCDPMAYLCHQFSHAHILHLLINVCAFIGLMEVVCQTLNPLKITLVAYLASVISAIITSNTLPTIGCSAMVYFLLGVMLSLALGGKVLKIRDRKRMLLSILFIVLATVATLFTPMVATFNHIISLVIGLIFGALEHLQYSKYYR